MQVYKGELKLEEGAHFHDRPALDLVIRKFRAAKLTAYVAGLLFTILFVCVWPGSMLSVDVMSGYGFLIWTTLSRSWAFIAATFIILVPLIQEIHAIVKQHQTNSWTKPTQSIILQQGKQKSYHINNFNSFVKIIFLSLVPIMRLLVTRKAAQREVSANYFLCFSTV